MSTKAPAAGSHGGAVTLSPMLRALCFDLMDTLLYDPYREALQAAIGADVATVAELIDPRSWPDFEIGAIDEAEFARRFFSTPDAGRTFDLEAFSRVRRAGYRWLPGMRELVDDLRGRVCCYVASNYPIWIEDVRVAFALDQHFDGVYASTHLGVRKPDPRFYRRLLDAIGHDPAECLFVDDRRRNCEAAEQAGMRAHVVAGAGDLVSRLRAEGLAPREPA